MKTSPPVYVVDGSRTPFLRARGKQGPFTATDLLVAAGRPLLARQPFEGKDLSEVIVGCIIPSPDEVNIARVASLRLNCGHEVPAWTVQRNCGSGMQALECAADNIRSGRSQLVLAGGVESMSHAPILWGPQLVNWFGDFQKARTLLQRLQTMARLRPGFLKPVIGILRGLTDPTVNLNMGQTAEILAEMFKIDREEMDSYSLQSHERLARAMDEGRMEEIVPIYDNQGHCYQHDDGLRRDTSMTKLAQLRPVFDGTFGHITAGNGAQITDGATLLLLASQEAVKQYDLPILGTIEDSTWAGVPPEVMGLGPVHATAQLLQRNNLDLKQIDYWELNEAFAAQVLACIRAFADRQYCQEHFNLAEPLGTIAPNIINIDGGAISLGHPVGTSGARIVLHLLHVLREKQAALGIATLCIGGGQGGAMLLKATQAQDA